MQVFKIRKTIKTLQQLKDQLPFLAAEIIKELEFIANNDEHPDAFKRCQEVYNIISLRTYMYAYEYNS